MNSKADVGTSTETLSLWQWPIRDGLETYTTAVQRNSLCLPGNENECSCFPDTVLKLFSTLGL